MPECPRCGGLGWLRHELDVGDPLFGKLEPCDCQQDRALERLRTLSGLRRAELSVTLRDIQAPPGSDTATMLAACWDFIAEPRGFLTLWGSPGTGKTTCLYAITNALIGRGAVYISLHDLLDYARGGFDSTPEDDADERLRRFARVPVLCLDEIDKVQLSGWANEQLSALIDARFRSGLASETGTVLALNSDPRLLPAWIASRLRDGRGRLVCNAECDARPLMGRLRQMPLRGEPGEPR